MSNLVVLGFDGIHTADEVLNKLRPLQKEYLIDLEDACVVERDSEGKVHIKQAVNLTALGAATGSLRGALWGTLVGILFLNPLAGMAMANDLVRRSDDRPGGRRPQRRDGRTVLSRSVRPAGKARRRMDGRRASREDPATDAGICRGSARAGRRCRVDRRASRRRGPRPAGGPRPRRAPSRRRSATRG